jgi:hypothetical protein
MSAGLVATMTVAVEPSYIGQWFTLYEEFQGSHLVYKIDAQITKVIAKSVKTATISVDFRVTNNHPFGVHLTTADFWLMDKRGGKVALTISLPESTIPAKSVSDIFTTGKVVNVYGMGYRFLVQGEIEWYEIYDSGPPVGPFVKVFKEIHSPMEFTHG